VRLVYAKLRPGNFGDELNPYIWPRLFPKAFLSNDAIDFIGIGTILTPEVTADSRRKIVFGTGAGYWKPPLLDPSWTIYFVRGPLTAKLLRISTDLAITDAAYCLGFIDQHQPAPVAPERIVFMPHHKSEAEVDWRALCRDLGWDYASPAFSVEQVLDMLKSAKLVVTEAMHGAIVADLYRVPWVPVRYGFRSLDFKWRDWCSSLGIEYNPIDLPPLLDARLGARETIERVVKKTSAHLGLGKARWKKTPVFRSGREARDHALKFLGTACAPNRAVLSPDGTLERTMARLSEKIERFRAEYDH
jgi:succinoglycan biosynthesis protein ExoV